ncbi:MAG TPA: flagellar basal body P-ring protein FlgI [Bryobacteraceae bacterium]|nr:flagellar basal body P-ring protein FlgI [Bryobacteraceae bacterium]
MKSLFITALLPFVIHAAPDLPPGSRLKELVTIEGVRTNQLIGYGLVVGLAGTGDRQQTIFSVQTLTNMLQHMGVNVPPSAIMVKNTAAVMITATLPPFAQPGTTIDVTVAAAGDASNLQGGILLMTMLRGVNGEVFATAQGPVVTGGFVAGNSLSKQTVNHPTVGRIPNGASIERPAPSPPLGKVVRLQLRDADFTTAERVQQALNSTFGKGGEVAHAENSALISVAVPPEYAGRPADFIADLERVIVQPDVVARVVINERTGTITLGRDVRIAPVAIMHGALSVEIQNTLTPTQPEAFSQGKTQLVPSSQVNVSQDKAHNIMLQQGATVEEVVKSLNAIGSTPRDVIDILQALRAAGALNAEVEVI